jgi:nitroreductase
MGTASLNDVRLALNWRFAIKKFDPARRVPDETWNTIQQAAIYAPSSYGLQPWKFVVITEPTAKALASANSYNQPQPKDCSHFVVFAARKGVNAGDVERYMARTASVRGVPRESLNGFADAINGTIKTLGPEGADVWCSRQAYIALGFLLSACAMLGVDACPMEGIDRAAHDRALGLDKLGYGSLCAAAVGYRAADDDTPKRAKVRFEERDVVIRV